MATKPIVAGTDGSQASLRAVEWAAREAILRGVPLRIVSAAELLPRMIERQSISDYDTVAESIRKRRDRALAAAVETVAAMAPDLIVDADELSGAPAQSVMESGSGSAMLVVGAHGGGGFSAMLLGSVSRYAATHASCPVVVVREETEAVHRHVGLGLGNLDDCAASVGFAFEEAALRKASVVAIHAWHDSHPHTRSADPGSAAGERYAADRLADLLAEWQGKYPGVEVSQDVFRGHPARALIGLSARADLVVLGRHARHGALPGPSRVTHAVLNHAHGPIVTVPSP